MAETQKYSSVFTNSLHSSSKCGQLLLYLCLREWQTAVERNTAVFVVQSSHQLLSRYLWSYSGYLLSQTGITSKTNRKLAILMNSGLIVGLLLSLVLDPDMALLILPCVCAGLQIYCSIFICFGFIFTNGEKPKEDRSRFGAVLIAFFATVLYYPICYLLRIWLSTASYLSLISRKFLVFIHLNYSPFRSLLPHIFISMKTNLHLISFPHLHYLFPKFLRILNSLPKSVLSSIQLQFTSEVSISISLTLLFLASDFSISTEWIKIYLFRLYQLVNLLYLISKLQILNL